MSGRTENDANSDLHNPNNDYDLDDWANEHNPNNEDYLGDDELGKNQDDFDDEG